MHSKTIDCNARDQLFMKGKLVSDYLFPLGQKFTRVKFKEKCQNQIQKYKSRAYSSLKCSLKCPFLAKPVTMTEQKAQQLIFSTAVSQIQSQRTVKKQYDSLYSACSLRLPSKNAKLYRKKLISLDIPNVNELNVTNFKNFKIGASRKSQKQRNQTFQQVINNNQNANKSAFSFFIQGDTQQKQISKTKKHIFLQKKVQIKAQCYNSQRFNNLALFSPKLDEGQTQRKMRKIQISPWQNTLG